MILERDGKCPANWRGFRAFSRRTIYYILATQRIAGGTHQGIIKMNLFYTNILLVIIGVTIAVTTQIIVRYVLDPLKEFKMLRMKISHSIDFNARFWASPGHAPEDVLRNASSEIRDIGMRLPGQATNIPYYAVTARLLGYPPLRDISEASRLSVQLSNSMIEGSSRTNSKTVDEILDLLRLPNKYI